MCTIFTLKVLKRRELPFSYDMQDSLKNDTVFRVSHTFAPPPQKNFGQGMGSTLVCRDDSKPDKSSNCWPWQFLASPGQMTGCTGSPKSSKSHSFLTLLWEPSQNTGQPVHESKQVRSRQLPQVDKHFCTYVTLQNLLCRTCKKLFALSCDRMLVGEDNNIQCSSESTVYKPRANTEGGRGSLGGVR